MVKMSWVGFCIDHIDVVGLGNKSSQLKTQRLEPYFMEYDSELTACMQIKLSKGDTSFQDIKQSLSSMQTVIHQNELS